MNEENVNPPLKTRLDEVKQSSMWYLDTRAINHMTGDKCKFREVNKRIQGYVKFRNESKVIIVGRGTIFFQCKSREYHKLDEVYYIPDLCSNIISLRQLAECGYEIRIKDLFLWVHEIARRLLMMVQRSPSQLYKIELKESSQCA